MTEIDTLKTIVKMHINMQKSHSEGSMESLNEILCRLESLECTDEKEDIKMGECDYFFELNNVLHKLDHIRIGLWHLEAPILPLIIKEGKYRLTLSLHEINDNRPR